MKGKNKSRDSNQQNALNSWIEFANNPDPPCLESIWSKHTLSIEQREILHKYEKYIKRMVQRIGFPWAMLAEYLIKFDSTSVVGNKHSFLKKLFGRHLELQVKLRSNGFSIRTKSNEFFNILFELKLIYYFVVNDFTVSLSKDKKNEPNPEFTVVKNAFSFLVEAKNLDTDKVLDLELAMYEPKDDKLFSNITEQFKGLSSAEMRDRFVHMVQRNYENACLKFKNKDAPYLIFIRTSSLLEAFDPEISDYLNYLQDQWVDENAKFPTSLVIIEHNSTRYIENSSKSPKLSELLIDSKLHEMPYTKEGSW